MPSPQEFVTTASIVSFGGASLAVLLISTTVQRVWGRTMIAVPFVCSIVVGATVAAYTQQLTGPIDWLVAFVNCCLLFCTATGANELIAERPANASTKQAKIESGKWFSSWVSS